MLRKIINKLAPQPKNDYLLSEELFVRKRLRILERYGINTILDVGANTGQYATQTLSGGFKGSIISFEPLPNEFAEIERKAKDFTWKAYNYALGDENGDAEINYSENSYSSSLLELKQETVDAIPATRVVNKIAIKVFRLDHVWDSLNIQGRNIFLKIDAQGFEEKVLIGAGKKLEQVKGIQLEMSLRQLYEGEKLYDEMIRFLKQQGFTLCLVDSGYMNEQTDELLQMDGVFMRIGQP
ncbi:FkbM family methyltransferase [Terrimonas sp. NA20]|uniref:FkbM family methyltransferase n=1 Tax=Terrimonas ginsenosidimutans TaxID=2908004 RepID=A0ABS9KNR4_9BACT|nr:FkbM family methyltransferase [Terrimonas ginsenosidimutans]MCG2613972.1 FkbM family methyltransferase [Terrimonas ginsenosidimutans]